jgi:hypothetical protein
MKKSLLVLTILYLSVSHLLAQVPSYVPTDGLVGWWPLNGSITDLSGNNYNGNLLGGASSTADRFGSPASAIALANGGQSCSLPAPAPGTFNTAMSYSFWYKEQLYPSPANQVLFYAAGKYLTLQPQSTSIRAQTGGNFNVFGSNSNLASSGWKHVVVVYEEFAVTIYIDGVIANSTASNVLPDPIQFLNSASQVGGTDGVNPFSGSVDDVGFWNRPLNRNEVVNLFNSTISTPQLELPNYLPTDGLVGWWPLDGNTYDYSGNGRNAGVSIGSVNSEDRFGNMQSAYSLTNGQGCILPPTEAGTYVDAMSYSFWYQEAEFPTSNYSGLFFAAGKSLLLSPGSSGLRAYSGTSEYVDALSDDLFTNQWKHVVVVYSGQTVSIYVNGVLSVADVYNEPVTYENIISFGGGYAGGNYIYNGKIDDIAMYNRALNSWEISSLFLNEPVSAPECPSLSSNLQQGLVGYWPFCGNANDESGNGNDGVVNGATLTEDRFGNANAAFNFDGNDWIESSAIGMSNGNNSATISGWFKRASNASGVEYIVGYGNPNILQGSAFSTGEYGSQGAFATFLGSSYDAISGVQLPIESWHQLTSIHNQDGQVSIYLDGQLSYTAIVQTPDIQNMLTRIGRAVWGSEEFWNGSLDDIAIWNRALTPEEVQELYTLDACTFTIYDTLTVENVINVYDTLTIENIVDVFDTTYIYVEVYDTLTVENIVNVYDTLIIENVVTVYDTLYTNVENIINVYDTTYTNIENVIDVYDTTTVVETVFEYDTLTIENIVEVYDTLTIENVIDVYDTTTVVETVLIYDTLTVENVIDVYDTTYVTVTDTLIIDIPSGVGGTILNTLLLYPNPTSDQLTINYGNFAAMAGYSLSIFNNGGSAVYEDTDISQAQETLDISQWSAGVYQVVVYNTGGVPVETRQIVIQ